LEGKINGNIALKWLLEKMHKLLGSIMHFLINQLNNCNRFMEFNPMKELLLIYSFTKKMIGMTLLYPKEKIFLVRI